MSEAADEGSASELEARLLGGRRAAKKEGSKLEREEVEVEVEAEAPAPPTCDRVGRLGVSEAVDCEERIAESRLGPAACVAEALALDVEFDDSTVGARPDRAYSIHSTHKRAKYYIMLANKEFARMR